MIFKNKSQLEILLSDSWICILTHRKYFNDPFNGMWGKKIIQWEWYAIVGWFGTGWHSILSGLGYYTGTYFCVKKCANTLAYFENRILDKPYQFISVANIL